MQHRNVSHALYLPFGGVLGVQFLVMDIFICLWAVGFHLLWWQIHQYESEHVVKDPTVCEEDTSLLSHVVENSHRVSVKMPDQFSLDLEKLWQQQRPLVTLAITVIPSSSSIIPWGPPCQSFSLCQNSLITEVKISPGV